MTMGREAGGTLAQPSRSVNANLFKFPAPNSDFSDDELTNLTRAPYNASRRVRGRRFLHPSRALRAENPLLGPRYQFAVDLFTATA
jgi:hypothetical protein